MIITMAKTIAIIGGGASATLLLTHLVREEAVFERIDVYDRKGAFGKGIAYATTNFAHPLNVRAANMSGYADEKDDLVEWLERHHPEYSPIDFIPRAVYAQYLQDLLTEAQKKLPVNLITADIQTSKFTPGEGYSITVGGSEKKYDEVVQATGNVRPIHIEADKDCSLYHVTPYKMDYAAIKKDGHVVILGSGLSAVDAILGLEEAGFKGRITIISSRGWFPARHAAPQVWEAMEAPLNNRSVADWMRAIRVYVQKAVEGGLFWQTAIDSLRAETNPIWESLTTRQRDIFMRHGVSAWNIHRHRMPPESADMIAGLRKSGRLNIIRDVVKTVERGGTVVCRESVVKDADAVINALGYRYDEKGRDYDVSYKIGPANFGELFETTAIPEIRAQAQDIAKKLAR